MLKNKERENKVYTNYTMEGIPKARKKNSGNIYKTYRINAGYTQESAAERLHLSVRSLCDYERGFTPVPDDVAGSMAELYGAPKLMWLHMTQKTSVSRHLPDISINHSAESATMRLMWAVKQIAPVIDDMLIVANGEPLSDDVSLRATVLAQASLEYWLAKK